MVKRRRKRKTGIGRNTSRAAGILENMVNNLRSHGFTIFTYPKWRSLPENELPDDYVVRNWPHDALYGTPGKKEALIVTQRSNPNGVEYIKKENITRIILEAKYQDGSGSVDEKFPYIWEAFLISDIPNWILLYAGKFWHDTLRGKAAVKWIKDRNANPKIGEDDLLHDKTLYILNEEEFSDMIKETWR